MAMSITTDEKRWRMEGREVVYSRWMWHFLSGIGKGNWIVGVTGTEELETTRIEMYRSR